MQRGLLNTQQERKKKRKYSENRKNQCVENKYVELKLYKWKFAEFDEEHVFWDKENV